MGGFLVPILRIVSFLLGLYWWVVIAAAVMSWLVNLRVIDTHNRPVAMIGDFLYRATEPALRPIRRFVPSFSGIDISPIILLAVIWLVQMELEHLAFYLYEL